MSGNSGAEKFNTDISVPEYANSNYQGAEVAVDNNCAFNNLKEEVITTKIDSTNKNNEVLEETVNDEKYKEVLQNKPKISESDTEILSNEDELVYESDRVENVKNIVQCEDVLTKETNLLENQNAVINDNYITKEITVDIEEVRLGFEDARRTINSLYSSIFSKSINFKPTINDVIADLLAFLGGKALTYKKGEEYLKTFGIDATKFSSKYIDVNYIPLCIKLSVWADKNKNANQTPLLLNGLLRSLFALGVKESEVETVEFVKNSIISILNFIENEGLNIDF